jgi:hypothetical protein
MNKKEIIAAEEKLVDFWNMYMELLRTPIKIKNKFLWHRQELFEKEVACSVHDIQGRLAILKAHCK